MQPPARSPLPQHPGPEVGARGSFPYSSPGTIHFVVTGKARSRIRQAIRAERKLEIAYRPPDRDETRRTIWPFALAYFDRARVVVAWCELRNDFRSFRTDRISSLSIIDRRYPRRRQALLKEWRTREGISTSR